MLLIIASVAVLGPLHGGDSSPLASGNTTSCTAPPSRPGAAGFRWGQALCRFPHPCRFLLRPLVLQLSAPFKGVDTWWGPCQTQPPFLGHCRALAFFIEHHFLEGPGCFSLHKNLLEPFPFYSPTIPIAEQSSHHCSQVKQEAQKAVGLALEPRTVNTDWNLYQEVLAL